LRAVLCFAVLAPATAKLSATTRYKAFRLVEVIGAILGVVIAAHAPGIDLINPRF
jgi:hypothetical protein